MLSLIAYAVLRAAKLAGLQSFRSETKAPPARRRKTKTKMLGLGLGLGGFGLKLETKFWLLYASA